MSNEDHQSGCNCGHDMSDEQLLARQADAKINLAIQWAQKNRLDAAEPHLAAAVKLLELSEETDSAAWNSYHLARGLIAEKRNQPRAALRHMRKAYAIAKKLYCDDHYMLAVAQANYGECLAKSGQLEKGRNITAQALANLITADVGSEAHMIAWKDNTVEEINQVLESLT